MSSEKDKYVKAIRAETTYPVYRSIIGVIALLVYAIAASLFIGSSYLTMTLGNVDSAGMQAFFAIIGYISSILFYVIARFWKEAALIVADIGDSVTEVCSRGTEDIEQ